MLGRRFNFVATARRVVSVVVGTVNASIGSWFFPLLVSYHCSFSIIMGQSQIENAVESTFFITEFTIQK